jgi:DUF917 family protein
MDYVRAVELVAAGGTPVDGLITNECGGLATVNGWFQAAVLGLPVVDAPCNGRAHPTGLMGSIGLQRLAGYTAVQAAVGGDAQAARRVEMLARGPLERAAALVLQASIQAGGMVAVARNPVSVAYAREHAAAGAIRQCIAVGQTMLERRGAGPDAMIGAASEVLGGRIAAVGQVADVTLETVGGLDVGTIRVDVGRATTAELVFWNEYMCLDLLDATGQGPGNGALASPGVVGGTDEARAEGGGAARRLATFPDLMATFDARTGLPISSAEVRPGQSITILHVDRRQLRLGAGMRDAELLRTVESATGRAVLRYLDDDLTG